MMKLTTAATKRTENTIPIAIIATIPVSASSFSFLFNFLLLLFSGPSFPDTKK